MKFHEQFTKKTMYSIYTNYIHIFILNQSPSLNFKIIKYHWL